MKAVLRDIRFAGRLLGKHALNPDFSPKSGGKVFFAFGRGFQAQSD